MFSPIQEKGFLSTLRILPWMIIWILFSCSKTAPEVVADWEEDGWILVQVHGQEKKFSRTGELKSKTAKSIEASWIERGYRKTKIYSQKTHYYLVLRFFCEDGDEFVAVMKKRK